MKLRGEKTLDVSCLGCQDIGGNEASIPHRPVLRIGDLEVAAGHTAGVTKYQWPR